MSPGPSEKTSQYTYPFDSESLDTVGQIGPNFGLVRFSGTRNGSGVRGFNYSIQFLLLGKKYKKKFL